MIAAKNHKNGVGNPYAQMRKDLGYEFCRTESEKNPFVAGPLKRTDCSLVSDGAAAIVLADVETALRLGKAIAFRATAHVQDFLPMSKRDILKFEGCAQAWKRALADAGITLGDLSLVETHDCFTIAELIEYEAMGLVPEGQGARAIKEGWTQKDGKLPVNPSGGLKAKGHPIGATGVSMHALCAMQLTGTAGDIQVQERQARRHLQHGRRGGRELRQHPGADQVAAGHAHRDAALGALRGGSTCRPACARRMHARAIRCDAVRRLAASSPVGRVLAAAAPLDVRNCALASVGETCRRGRPARRRCRSRRCGRPRTPGCGWRCARSTSRCAMTKVVRSFITSSSAACTFASVAASSALVASSRIRIGGFFEQRARDRDALALAARQHAAALAHRRFEAFAGCVR